MRTRVKFSWNSLKRVNFGTFSQRDDDNDNEDEDHGGGGGDGDDDEEHHLMMMDVMANTVAQMNVHIYPET